ncbi:MAG: GNAT family N-acetyltransferase [Phycisphaerales bacterium]|nr:GNAT family N-acetyltransferase [Phycisphaerales bacterium]
MIIREVEFGGDGYREVLAMRDRLLRVPLGLTWSQADLEGEAEQLHFGLYDHDDTLIACVVIKPLDEHNAKLRQMAVDEQYRQIGAGRRLIQGVEDILKQRGFRCIKMDARDTAVGFYRKLGYEIQGDVFTQVTIPHFRMTKVI